MQFMPSTWATYGVDANGDGKADPYNPEDAIFAAASYLHAAGMPTDTYGAIFAYNHADWYVAEVLADAACYAGDVGVEAAVSSLLEPQLPVLECEPAKSWRKRIPTAYLKAFEDAAGRYELGRRGVWALAAVARLESNFGRGMTARELRHAGPLGLEPSEWKRYAVDGDDDGRIRHADPADSAATLARLIWSRKSLSAGLFTHNHAEWYVHEVLQEAAQLRGKCKVSYVEWKIAPLPAGLETAGPELSPRRQPGERPARRPAGGQGGDRRGQLDLHHPLHLGRRPRRLDLDRLRLLGRGQLRPLRRRAARPPADLGRTGALRRTRSRPLDHDLRQPDPHLRRDRRPALGHGRRRVGHRPALACGASLSGRLRRPASDGVLSRLARRRRLA